MANCCGPFWLGRRYHGIGKVGFRKSLAILEDFLYDYSNQVIMFSAKVELRIPKKLANLSEIKDRMLIQKGNVPSFA